MVQIIALIVFGVCLFIVGGLAGSSIILGALYKEGYEVVVDKGVPAGQGRYTVVRVVRRE